jgi:hypothetical protein
MQWKKTFEGKWKKRITGQANNQAFAPNPTPHITSNVFYANQ